MVPAVTILIFAWSLKGMGDALGLAEFVGGIVGDNASASIFIPVDFVCSSDLSVIFYRNVVGNICNSRSDSDSSFCRSG